MHKILIVDDIDTNRRMIRKMLEMLDIGILIEATNGREAIEKFENEDPDLILMDINMPEMDGFQAAAAIKALTGDNYVPIIFVTALSSESSLGYALASGGDDYISKPVNLEILESKIHAQLRIRKLNQQLNYRNKRLMHEQELIEYFFESAVNKSFLDKRIIRYHMSSISTFNGDLLLVERGPNGGFYVLMGDFTGHGLTAAMGTLPVAMIFFKMTRKGINISDIAAELNLQLHELMPTGMFFTASLIEINSRCDMMSVWMGGVPETYLLDDSGDLKAVIESKHMPLGVLGKEEFDSTAEIYNIDRGDKIYLYSDGVIEATNTDGEMFGNERLKNIVTGFQGDRFSQILNELTEFVNSGSQTDDISLVEITCDLIEVVEEDTDTEQENLSDIQWQTRITISHEKMRDCDPVPEIASMLGAMPGLGSHTGALNVLLGEMYSNALEHSILELDSSLKTDERRFEEYYIEREKRIKNLENACISFSFSYLMNDNKNLQIVITDNGRGFENKTDTSEDGLHGRGMAIIESLSESYEFSDNGNTLTVNYAI